MLPGTGSSEMHPIPFQSPDNCGMSQPENLNAQELLWSNNVEMPAICDESSTSNPTTIKKTQASAPKKSRARRKLEFPKGKKKTKQSVIGIPKMFLESRSMVKKLAHENNNLRRKLITAKKRALKIKKNTIENNKKVQAILKSVKGIKPLAEKLFHNELENAGLHPNARRYSTDIKDLSIRLSFHASGTGYEFIRSIFTLPTSRSIRNYLSSVNCIPGHLHNVMMQLGEDIKNKLYDGRCILVLDGMATRKFAGYDPQLKAYTGMCTIQDEDELEDVHEQLATECLVFMLVGVDPRWKKRLPVGYWFTRHDTANNVGNLVKETLQFSHQHGIDVVGLVFQGLSSLSRIAREKPA